MELKSLHIYGYGKLIDFHIHNLSSLQLFLEKMKREVDDYVFYT
ncbi:hypothetical protein ACI2OX_15385 [Bacillus sp. N9]